MSSKNYLSKKIWKTHFWVQKVFGSKEVWSIKGGVQHLSSPQKNVGPKMLVKIGAVITLIMLIWANVNRTCVVWTNGTLNVGSVKDCPRNINFDQNRINNIWDNPNMDKCCQDICYLDKSCHDSWHLLKIVPGTCIWILVQIGSVTAEILLIWTNIARTNVAFTNVTVTVGICFRCSQDPLFKVWSKSDQ